MALKHHTIAGHTSPMRFHYSALYSARLSSLVSQSARFSLVASTPKPDLGLALGIGPALRVVASMSRQDWAKKLIHQQTEFVDMLKLLGVDVKIGCRLLAMLACGKSLSRRDRQQLTS
ncbi:mitochondrial proton/calcium exchanger protein [Tanacetum coccineum]